jgi:hypothetical protein
MSAVLRSQPIREPATDAAPRRRACDGEAVLPPAGELVHRSQPAGDFARRPLAVEVLGRFAREELLPRPLEARAPAGGLRRRASDDEATDARSAAPARHESRATVDGLQRLVCISEIAPATTEIDVHVIASITGLHHRRMDVTGVLVRGGGYLVQLVEGRAEALEAVLRRVEAESRHCATRVLSNAPITKRRFDRWATLLVQDETLVRDIGELHRSGQIGEQLMAAIVERL